MSEAKEVFKASSKIFEPFPKQEGPREFFRLHRDLRIRNQRWISKKNSGQRRRSPRVYDWRKNVSIHIEIKISTMLPCQRPAFWQTNWRLLKKMVLPNTRYELSAIVFSFEKRHVVAFCHPNNYWIKATDLIRKRCLFWMRLCFTHRESRDSLWHFKETALIKSSSADL